MRRLSRLALAVSLLTLAPLSAQAAFTIAVDALDAGKPIAAPQALCVPTADGKSDKITDPTRPTIRWSGAPAGTKSFALFMMDPDVPADFTDAGKEGKVIAADAKRQDFFHYGVVGIAASETSLNGGISKLPITTGRELPNDLGANGYVPALGNYGGPCPPWNDARMHHYHFIVLALDAKAPIAPVGTDKATAKATFNRLISSKHVLGKAAVVGTYTLNQSLRAKGK
jgi:phosphatidylethanolamine-binding protein (PEBP) family uncharacterized protein